MLEVSDLCVRAGRRELLQGVNLRAAPGRITAIIGPSGAGKSTLLRAISGDIGYVGRIALNGRDIARTPAPALAQLRASPARHAALDAQLQQMQALQAQALHLKDIPRPTGNETLPVLWRSLGQQLSAGTQMSTTGDRAAITLKDVPPEALAQWLAQVRSTTRAVPTEARLMRNTASTGGASPPAPWNGTLTLALPPN